MMKLPFISLLILAIIQLCLATTETISFNTTMVEVEEKDDGHNKVVLKVVRSGGTAKTPFFCTVGNNCYFNFNVIF